MKKQKIETDNLTETEEILTI